MDWTTHAAGGEGSHERCGIVSCNACCARCSGASPGNYQVRARRSTGTSRISFDWGTPCVCPFRPQCAELLFRLTETGNRKDQIRNYAASCFKLFDMFRTSRSGNSANTLTVGTHRARCSSSSYLARSISTLFWAASFVQTRKHAEERAAPQKLVPGSYRLGNSYLRSSGVLPDQPYVQMRSWFKNCLKSRSKRYAGQGENVPARSLRQKSVCQPTVRPT